MIEFIVDSLDNVYKKPIKKVYCFEDILEKIENFAYNKQDRRIKMYWFRLYLIVTTVLYAIAAIVFFGFQLSGTYVTESGHVEWLLGTGFFDSDIEMWHLPVAFSLLVVFPYLALVVNSIDDDDKASYRGGFHKFIGISLYVLAFFSSVVFGLFALLIGIIIGLIALFFYCVS